MSMLNTSELVYDIVEMLRSEGVGVIMTDNPSRDNSAYPIASLGDL